jgi:hypothetical protein
MLHLKYYIILLIGIFLALGLGILIGVTLENNNVLENQQELIIRQIESEFEALRNEADMLKKTLAEVEEQKAQADSTCEYLFSRLIEDRLHGLKVSIINLGQDNISPDLIQLLKLAGASVESSITVRTDLYARQDLSAALEAFLQNGHDGMERNDFHSIVAGELVSSLIEGAFTPLSVRLKEMHLIQASSNLKQSSDVVILSGNGKNKQAQSSQESNFDIVLIQTALDMGLPVVAVDPSSVEESAISEYEELGVSTVRDIDTVYGKLALISILEANKPE